MAESLSDRLKRLAAERTLGQQAEKDVRELQRRADAFISDNARPEFEKLHSIIKSLIDDVNPTLTDFPKFQLYPNGMIQQGNYVAFIRFDKPSLNESANRLVITFGPHPNAMYFDEPPEPRRFDLHAGCNDAINEILWQGDFGELRTRQLADVILEGLTQYWIDHTPHSAQF